MVFKVIYLFVLLNILNVVFRGGRYFLEVSRFMSFAKDNCYDVWEHLTSVRGLGSGHQINQLRALEFFLGNNEVDDVSLERSRKRVKGRFVSVLLAITGIFGSFACLVLYALYKEKGG